jgi:hypothetical protein
VVVIVGIVMAVAIDSHNMVWWFGGGAVVVAVAAIHSGDSLMELQVPNNSHDICATMCTILRV